MFLKALVYILCIFGKNINRQQYIKKRGMFMDINYILSLEEGSVFDRKSIKIKPKELAKHIIAFANSDGGMIAIGITDKNRIIEGIDYYEEKINEILEVPFRYCFPSIRVKSKRIECIDSS